MCPRQLCGVRWRGTYDRLDRSPFGTALREKRSLGRITITITIIIIINSLIVITISLCFVYYHLLRPLVSALRPPHNRVDAQNQHERLSLHVAHLAPAEAARPVLLTDVLLTEISRICFRGPASSVTNSNRSLLAIISVIPRRSETTAEPGSRCAGLSIGKVL